MGIDKVRQVYLAIAEAVDAMRLIPRALVAGYAYVFYQTIVWYKELQPYMLDNCISQTVTDCIVQAPTTQHAALVTAVVGVAGAIIGLYSATGRKWNGFTFWKKKPTEKPVEKTEEEG